MIRRTFATTRTVALGLSLVIAPSVASAGFLTFQAADPGLSPSMTADSSQSAIEAGHFITAARATGSLNLVDLSSVPLGTPTGSETIAPGLSLAFSGVDRSPPAGYSFGVAADHPDTLTGYPFVNADRFIRFVPQGYTAPGTGSGAATLTFQFSSQVSAHAFGVYLTGLGTAPGVLQAVVREVGASAPVTLTLTGSPLGGLQFFGLIDPSASIASVSFVLSGSRPESRDVLGLAGIRYATTVAEPSSALLLGLATVGLLLTRRAARPRSRGPQSVIRE